MMALPMLLLVSINREALFLATSGAMLGVWWAFLFWGIWAGVRTLWAVVS